MGQLESSLVPLKLRVWHASGDGVGDALRLCDQTLPLREHLFGPSDIVLVVGQNRIHAHRDVLSEQSQFFKSMLTSFAERTQKEVALKLDIGDSPSQYYWWESRLLALAVHFAYFRSSSQHLLTPRNALDLLAVAEYLQMGQLRSVAIDFVRQRLDRRNCVAIYLHAVAAGPFELQRHAENFILAHFEDVASVCRDFVQCLSASHLLRLLTSEGLVVSSELSVFRAVLRWAAFQPSQRAGQLDDLMQHVHFRLMSPQEIQQCKKLASSKLRGASDASRLLEQFTSALTPSVNIALPVSSRAKPPRWPKLLVVVRMYWRNLPMEYYDFGLRQWGVLGAVQGWRSCAALVAHNGCVWLIGGEETDADSPTGSRTVNRVTKFDCETGRWTSAPSMNLARRWAAAVILNDILYVIGGIGGRGGTFERRLDSVESLDLSSSSARWRLLPGLTTARSSHTAEALEGGLYVVGGGNGSDWLCTAEVFWPQKQRWAPLAALATKRWKCGICALGGHLYAVGGMDSPAAGMWSAPLRSVERYSPSDDAWTEVAPMIEARFGCAVVSYQGRIYVSGGFGRDKAILSSAEVYDPETNRWTKLPNMKAMCGFVGGVLVDRPVHMNTLGEGIIADSALSSHAKSS